MCGILFNTWGFFNVNIVLYLSFFPFSLFWKICWRLFMVFSTLNLCVGLLFMSVLRMNLILWLMMENFPHFLFFKTLCCFINLKFKLWDFLFRFELPDLLYLLCLFSDFYPVRGWSMCACFKKFWICSEFASVFQI